MNTYYSYKSYHSLAILGGTAVCALAWDLLGSGWWNLPFGAVLLSLWLPVFFRRPCFLSITQDSIAWGNSLRRHSIPWNQVEAVDPSPDAEEKPGLQIALQDGRILDVPPDCFDSLSSVRNAIVHAAEGRTLRLASDLFAPQGTLEE